MIFQRLFNTFYRGTLFATMITVATASMAAQKFDAHLARLVANPSADTGLDSRVIQAKSGAGHIETLLRFEGASLERVVAAGGKVRSVLGNIATVDIPVSAIGTIAELPEVIYIEHAKKQVSRLNHSVPATRVHLLRGGTAPAFTGLTGKNVIIGILDDGLDFRHLDFRKADGTTRILELWDQRATGSAGSAPPSYAYGGICTAAMINSAIGGNAASCTQPSTGNHGTHVGGIAAGNGQQTGNGRPAYRFVGMAPEADILVANSLNADAPGSAVVDAVAWMKARAQALGKPLVINMSLGSYFGPRDGTSNYETALSNASAAGVIITGAAGNEGNDAIRAVGTISQAETKTVNFNWAGTVNTNQRIEMWYPGTNQYSIRVTGPGMSCGTGTFVAAGSTQTFNPACGTIEVTSTAVQTNNDDRQILVNFTVNPMNAMGFHGAWTVEIQGDVVGTANTPFSLICGETGNGLLFTSNTQTVTKSILTDTASATRVVAVAAYNTNYNWLTTGGAANTPPDHGPLGDVSTFSSRGPRRDCSNLAKCPRVMKPEITAPGAMIMSALGQDATAVTTDAKEQDGVHVAYNGTSMATPHVSGAIAIMLEKNPNLTPEAVKRILAQNRQTNMFTTALPTFDPLSPLMPTIQNDNWGYGILDAKAAADAISTAVKQQDINGDGNSDILWRNNDGTAYAWTMNGLNVIASGQLTGAGNWTIQRTGDVNGDGKADLIWKNTDGTHYLWLMNVFTPIGTRLLTGAGTGWNVTHLADLNGDNKADILWRHTDGTIFAWLMDGVNIISSGQLLGAGTGYQISHTADLNGDGKRDIVWKHTDGSAYAWLMNGLTFTGTKQLIAAGSGYVISHVADLNGDSKNDILWRHTNGTVFGWLMNGLDNIDNRELIGSGTGYTITHTADFNNDGRTDLVWKHTDGTVFGWLMNGLVPVETRLFLSGTVNPNWTLTHTLDLSGDGKQDILWRNTDGTVFAWIMNGLNVTLTKQLQGTGTPWTVTP